MLQNKQGDEGLNSSEVEYGTKLVSEEQPTDEIVWDKKPTDTCKGNNDEEILYRKYYETQIFAIKWPLLISMPKDRET